MIGEYSEIVSLISELDMIVEKDTDIFMIGGGALMKYGLRHQTKDIDIVVNTEEEFRNLVDALLSSGFEKKVPENETYGRLTLSHILIRGHIRIDLFCRCVCGKFSLSKKMMDRASVDVSLSRVRLLVCSLSDIFLFKSMTERDGDFLDCLKMTASYSLDWDAILDEAVSQSVDEHSVWITWITKRMEELSEEDANIPILEKMISLSDEYIEKWGKELEERCRDK